MILVRKPDGSYRFCVDFRALNAVTITQYLSIPRTDEILDEVGQNNPSYFTTFDLQSAFHQVGLTEESRDKTAFITSSGKYRYKTMPMGLKNAPFQALMDMVLAGTRYKHVLCYLDDLILFSSTFEQHLKDMKFAARSLENTSQDFEQQI